MEKFSKANIEKFHYFNNVDNNYKNKQTFDYDTLHESQFYAVSLFFILEIVIDS